MDPVLRAVAVYVALLLLFRLAGKRTLSQVTTFDFVVLLIVGEATQQALLGEDFSITHAALVIDTLILLDRGADHLGFRFPRFQRVAASVPVILVDDGKVLHDVLRRQHVSEEEIMQSARSSQGLAATDQVRWVVLETCGGISVVPR